MKIRISFPGQEVQIIDAPQSVLNHYASFDYDPPFIERVKLVDWCPTIEEGCVPGTLWYRWMSDGKGNWFWDFNHFEDGHCPNSVPTPKHPNHLQTWKGGKWAKALVQLNRDNVVRHCLIF